MQKIQPYNKFKQKLALNLRLLLKSRNFDFINQYIKIYFIELSWLRSFEFFTSIIKLIKWVNKRIFYNQYIWITKEPIKQLIIIKRNWIRNDMRRLFEMGLTNSKIICFSTSSKCLHRRYINLWPTSLKK